MSAMFRKLLCRAFGHGDTNVEHVMWGGIDYERVEHCRRCGKRV